MELETLVTQLGISQHMKALSDWRDGFLRGKAEEIQTLRQSFVDQSDQLLASKSRITELEARVAALTPPAVQQPDIISELNHAFETMIPPEARPAFAGAYAVVRVLVQADQIDLARAYIVSVPVPSELEEAKAALLTFLA